MKIGEEGGDGAVSLTVVSLLTIAWLFGWQDGLVGKDLSLIARTHMMEGGNHLPPPYTSHNTCINKGIFLTKRVFENTSHSLFFACHRALMV